MHKQGRMAALCTLAALSCAGCMPALAKTTGVDLGANVTQDYFRDVSGGLRRGGGAPGTVNLEATIDGRAWGGSTNDMFYLDVLGTIGSSISNRVGDLQGLDNIEAYNTAKVYSAWYQHDFGDSGVMTRIGLQDWNAQFDALDAAGVFLNSSFGLDATTAQSNVSQFPTTAVGALVRWTSPGGVYVMGGVFDGVPGLPGHPAGTHVEFRSGDGTFSSVEAGIAGGGTRPYKLAIGGWYQTSDYEGPAGRSRDMNHGAYVIGQQRLLGGSATPTLDAFVQFGMDDNGRNPLDHYIGAGLNATGVFPSRPDDVFGVAVARAHASDIHRRVTPASEDAETAWELTYLAQINTHVFVQPDVQYIVHPGTDDTIDNALVVGLRMQLSW